MRNNVAVHVNDENGAIANARVAQAAEQMVDGNDRCEHSAELTFSEQRNGDDQRGAVVLAYAEWFADGVEALNAGGEGALERHCDEGIGVGAEAARGFAFRLRVDGGNVENVWIIFDEVLQQARHCGACEGSSTF